MKKGLILREEVEVAADGTTASDQRYFRILAKRLKKANADWDIRIETYTEAASPEFLADIGAATSLDLFAYIGHGGQDALYSAGIGTASETTSLASKLSAACNDGAAIIFYACNSGRLNDSILRDVGQKCLAKKFRLYGHSTAGRAGNNPNKTVYPPANGAMLIDEVLGVLADAPKFRRSWNATFGDENNSLWARFFRMTYTEIAYAASAPVLSRAISANARYKARLGWGENVRGIFELLLPHWGVGLELQAILSLQIPMVSNSVRNTFYEQLLATDAVQKELAMAVARWQCINFNNNGDADGIIGPNTWRAMQASLSLTESVR